MHVDTMTMRVSAFFEECDKLQKRKNRDYHPDQVAYLEILQTAFETGVTVEQDLWGRVRKQLSALRRYVIEGHVESEPPRSRMIDVAVYMGMMATWDERREKIVNDAFDFVRDNRVCETYGGKGFTDDDPAKSTCIRKGHSSDSRCDRCSFLMWLGDQHAPKVQA